MNVVPAETANTEAGGPGPAAKAPPKSRGPRHRRPTLRRPRPGRANGQPGAEGPQRREVGPVAKKATGARQGSKTAKVLDLLRRSDGAALKEVMPPNGLGGAVCLRGRRCRKVVYDMAD